MADSKVQKALELLGGGFNVYPEGFGFFLCSHSPDAKMPESVVRLGKPCQIFPVPTEFANEEEKYQVSRCEVLGKY